MELIRNYIVKSPWRKSVAKAILGRVPFLERLVRSHGKGKASARSRKVQARRVLDSGLFDADYYAKEVGVEFKSAREAAEHYVSGGEATGKRPSKLFDPTFYRRYYPDIRRLKGPMLLHFSDYGRGEGRFGAVSLDPVVRAGQRGHRDDWPTVLLCAHEASVTGAPILAYNIARHLSRSHNVVTALIRSGPLLEDFADCSTRLVVLDRLPRGLRLGAPVCESIVKAVHSLGELHAVIANSAVCEPLAAAASRTGLPVVTLVHEFAEYVGTQQMQSVLESSHILVFSSELTAQSVRDARKTADIRSLKILPQGKCHIPPSRDSKADQNEAITDNDLRWNRDPGKFLVVGCGFVQIRKGVDIFIATAEKVATTLGEDRVKFVWIGDGYNPKADFGYSLWLEDQIKRSGLERVVTIVPAMSPEVLDELYSVADAMLVSSRLDPLPNVAIDAMHAGLPVVCFDKTTGVAEYLRQVPGGEQLVVPYLDVGGAGAALVKLAADTSLRAHLGEHLKTLATQSFEIRHYVDRLTEYMSEAQKLRDQEQVDLATLRELDLSAADAACRRDPAATVGRNDLTEFEVRMGRFQDVGGGYRRPFSGFSPQIYVEHNAQIQTLPYPNPLAHWVRSGRPAGPWVRRVLQLSSSDLASSKVPKVGLHVHLHYPELIGDFLRRLEVNVTPCHLLVSCSSEEAKERLEHRLRNYRRGTYRVHVVPNRGRDLGPMITEFGSLLAEYDIIGHLHGKKSLSLDSSTIGDTWREFLWQNLLGDKVAALDGICAAFDRDDRLGLVFPEDPSIVGWNENRDVATQMAARVGINSPLPDGIEFPVGNMFFARPAAIAPLLASRLTWNDYPAEPLGYDGTMLHALERLTPLICESQGYHWLTTNVAGVTR